MGVCDLGIAVMCVCVLMRALGMCAGLDISCASWSVVYVAWSCCLSSPLQALRHEWFRSHPMAVHPSELPLPHAKAGEAPPPPDHDDAATSAFFAAVEAALGGAHPPA